VTNARFGSTHAPRVRVSREAGYRSRRKAGPEARFPLLSAGAQVRAPKLKKRLQLGALADR